MHYFKIYILTFLLLSSQVGEATIGKYPIKNFSPTEYKAGIQNIDFAQNRDMNLFVANNLGVLSFNGNNWETHAYNTGKKQRSLAFDDLNNRLYVGSQGDLGYFQGNWEYVSLIDKIPVESHDFDEVWDVFIYESKVYFCTFQAIYIYDEEEFTVLKHAEGFNRSFFSQNRLFTQTSSGALLEIEGGSLNANLKQSITNDIVAGVIPKDAGFIIFYNSGPIEFATQLGVRAALPVLAKVLEGNYVNHVLQLSDSRLVISTQRRGLFLYDMQNDLVENISTSQGLQSNACLRTYQDHTGNLWVGMQNGIALVDINSPLKLINHDIGIQGSGYEAFDTAEGTYYTTSNGIFFLESGSTRSIFLEGTEGPAYAIERIGNNLYASHHTGLFLLDKGKAIRKAFTDGLWQVKQLRSNPAYAIGGTYSGLHLFKLNNQNELVAIRKIEGFDESSRFYEEDRDGDIWVGQYYKGLYKLTLNDSYTEVREVKITSSSDLFKWEHIILSRIDDELYLGTESGIYKIDQATDSIVTDDLFSDIVGNSWVYLLEQDEQKNVHIFTENRVGFFRQVSSNNYAYIPSSLFQLRQSFNNDLLRVSKHVRQGVFVNANEGFIHYNPDLEDRLTIENKPIITRISNTAEDSVIYSRLPFENRKSSIGPIEIIQGTKILQFLVESFKFKDVNNNQFRYYLKGFDNDYSEWTNASTKEYTNLTAGNYEFSVETFNYLGEIVSSQPIAIKVYPPFFKSRTAKAFYVVLFVGLLVLLYSLQRRRYIGVTSKMEESKKEELAAKQTELQKLKEEQTETELRHVNNLLAASTMNLVVKNEFMESIKEDIKLIKEKKKSESTERALERIIKEIDTTLKLQEDWKQFEYHFDRVHGDFLTRLTHEYQDLTPGEQKLCAFLRLKMDTKEIANLMSISLRGVEVARYRLRKKLNLGKHQNLSKFILEY
jgi:ligand-binding sensor domain-containing protein/DNA-binding CsgD family transcriptional regulator